MPVFFKVQKILILMLSDDALQNQKRLNQSQIKAPFLVLGRDRLEGLLLRS